MRELVRGDPGVGRGPVRLEMTRTKARAALEGAGLDILEVRASDVMAAIDSPIDPNTDRPKLKVGYPRLRLLFWRDDDDDERGNVERRAPYFEGLLLSAPTLREADSAE